MNAPIRNRAVTATAVMLGLAFVYVVLMGLSSGIGSPFAQSVMIGTGSAILGSGLTFFLIQMFQAKNPE